MAPPTTSATPGPGPSAATQLWEEGRLDEAVTAAGAAVRDAPSNAGARRFLAELLCFSGDLDRADRHFQILLGQVPEGAAGHVLSRNLVAAERARRAVQETAVLPKFLEEPSPLLQAALRATVVLREGGGTEAAALLRMAASGPPLAGTCDGEAFTEFRDLDDVFALALEVMTPLGEYAWLDPATVQHLAFGTPRRVRDLLWRPVRLALSGARSMEAFMPVLYPGSHAATEPALRLGRATDWQQDGSEAPVRGCGLRCYLLDGAVRTALELEELRFGP